MSEELDYIKDAFTKTESNVNLEVDNLNVTCITSKNNKFNLDSEGNLTVKSISITDGTLSNQSIIDLIYPVGAIYTSVNSTNPNTIFGGTWEQLKDRFLLACGDTYENASTGGESSHTLTVDEMPSHNHTIESSGDHVHYAYFKEQMNPTSYYGTFDYARKNGASYDTTGLLVSGGAHTHTPGTTGLGQAHNNMPPYIAVYMWKRTA